MVSSLFQVFGHVGTNLKYNKNVPKQKLVLHVRIPLKVLQILILILKPLNLIHHKINENATVKINTIIFYSLVFNQQD